jgi:uncharacterized protein YbaR (Trm112 family)
MTTPDSASGLAALLICPRCARGQPALERVGWLCRACGAGYPVVGGIPWLFRDPQDVLNGWRTRIAMHLQVLRDEAAALELEGRALQGDATLDPTRRRLARVGAAKRDQAERLEALLQPFGPFGAANAATLRGLGVRLPTEQGLTNYYVNLHRDWVWGDDENAAALDEVRAVIGRHAQLGEVLVLGAGAGRFAYDLKRATPTASILVSDFNPLLLSVAREMYAGRELSLYEFPIAPRGSQDVAVLRTLRAPEAARPGLSLVAADVLDAPFAAHRFDTVITPWLIDVIGESLQVFTRRVNAWLKPGGRWVNSGSLAFNLPSHADRIGLDEALTIVAQSGFAAPDVRESTVPYMRSPVSRHARLETVVTWCATKMAEAAAPSPRDLPRWLLDRTQPVPKTAALEMEQVATRIHAFMLALVNGERSVADMARVIVEQRLLPSEEAEPAVRQFLRRAFEQSQQRADF